MSFVILGIGTATPRLKIRQHEAAVLAQKLIATKEPSERVINTIYRQTKIQERGSVLLNESKKGLVSQAFFKPATNWKDQGPSTHERMQKYANEATRLAVEATTISLMKSGVAAESITHLITCSCTGFQSPGIDIAIIEQLGLPRGVSRTNIGFMGCHGGFNALRVAQAYAEANLDATILVVCAELCSLHFQYADNNEQIVANSIFADGAAAIVGQATPQKNQPEKQTWELFDQSSAVIANTKEAMTWTVGDNGFKMTLSPEVPALITQSLPSITDSFLKKNNLSRDSVAEWAIHPGGPKILNMVEEALNLGTDALRTSRTVLSNFGNMSSATIFFILESLFAKKDENVAEGLSRTCIAMAFGPGLTAELALFQTPSSQKT